MSFKSHEQSEIVPFQNLQRSNEYEPPDMLKFKRGSSDDEPRIHFTGLARPGVRDTEELRT